jgi:endoglucanase
LQSSRRNAKHLGKLLLLGEAANSTNNVIGKPVEGLGNYFQSVPIPADDRLVFTEENPDREIMVAGQLATVARVMRSRNAAVAADALATAHALAGQANSRATDTESRVFAMAEIYFTTGERKYLDHLVALKPEIISHIDRAGWSVAAVIGKVRDKTFVRDVKAAVAAYEVGLAAHAKADSPYGVPYMPDIWGAGWTIQEFGVKQWMLHKGRPDLVRVKLRQCTQFRSGRPSRGK